ncbi:MAG: HEPN domain-containing protein [Candidatus Micrarchaeota archaeon]|nr:HEPN domain-containing protein [Candidatus Micrarchaeota archaeon]
MKKSNFLAKLAKEKKIQIVEPSEDVKDAYIQRSAESMVSAKTLAGIGNLKDAVALAYYSMYYMLLALLFKVGIKCENHTGAIMLLKDVFGIDNKDISTAKKERVDKQYYVDFSVTKNEVDEMIRTAEDFNSQLLDFIEKLNRGDAERFRNNAMILLSS